MQNAAPASTISTARVIEIWNQNSYKFDLVKSYYTSPKTKMRIERLLSTFPTEESWLDIISGTRERFRNRHSRRPTLDLIVTGDRPYQMCNLGASLRDEQ